MADIEMQKTERGKVIAYRSFAEAYEGQRARNKLVAKSVENLDIGSRFAPLLEAALKANNFKFKHFGLGKASKGTLSIFKHKPSGYLIRVYLDEAEYFEHKGKMDIMVDSWASKQVFCTDHDVSGSIIPLTNETDESLVMEFARLLDVAMTAQYGTKGNRPKTNALQATRRVEIKG